MNVKIGDHETPVALCEGAQFEVKEEVGDRTVGEEAWNCVCVDCRWGKIWVMGGVDGGSGGKFNGDGS